MAKRYIYHITEQSPYYEAVEVEFEYFNGFAVSQKQKSITSLHNSYGMKFPRRRVLEISSKSMQLEGVKASAFNLVYHGDKGDYPIECLFQGSKVFENGRVYQEIYRGTSYDAKKDERLKTSGRIVGFKLWDTKFASEPKDYFYNWLYISALHSNRDLADKLALYDSFSDIEFNPQKSINCQAIAAAIYVSLRRSGKLQKAMENPKNFLEIVYGIGERKPEVKAEQMSLFDLL